MRLDSGVSMYLPQGWDTQVLQEQGLTAMEAARQGRFFRVTFKICRQCGWMHEEPQICDPRAGGCLAAVIAAFIMLGILKFGMMLDWFSSLIGVWVGMLAVFGIVLLLRWARWHKQDAPLKLRNCLKCQAPDFVTVAKAAGKSLMCPHCHAQTMHYNRISRRT